MRKYNICFIATILLILALFFILSLGYPFRARIMPMIIIALAIIIAAVIMIKDILSLRKQASLKGGPNQLDSVHKAESKQMRFSMVLVWSLSLPLTIWLLGFLIALPVFVLAYIRLNGEKWQWAITGSLAMLVVVYFGFGRMLNMPLDAGFLIESIR